MSGVSVVGLGLMGAALARALHGAGHDLTVWNRSPGKMAPFKEAGVRCAEDLAPAVRASDVILFCIDNYTSTRAMLEAPDITPLLPGKIIVQLSSGSPKEAAAASMWAHERGARYLDGAILAGPTDIGTADATILLSGDQSAYDGSIGLLDCLGQGSVRYQGENVRAAKTLDLAWLTSRYGNFLAAIHAANLCQSEGVGVGEFAALVQDNPALQQYAEVIESGSFDDFTASLQVWGEALDHIRRQGVDAGINTEIPDFMASLFDRAIAAGQGRKHVMALIRVLQRDG